MMTNICSVECDAITGESCDFPFYYNGTWHYGCITHDNDGTPWCDVGNGKKESCGTDCPGRLVLTIQCAYIEAKCLLS